MRTRQEIEQDAKVALTPPFDWHGLWSALKLVIELLLDIRDNTNTMRGQSPN